ncbi:hypothetical protein [Lacticaseibacillus sp. GG6-2]
MENTAQTFSAVKQNLIASYRQFFALEAPVLTMPVSQRRLFIEQSLTRHYRVAVFFKDTPNALVGTITRRLDADRYLLTAYQSNLYRVISLDQLTYLKRV